MNHYRTEAPASATLPSGIPYIIINEAAERFSYYGMKAILVVYMTQWLTNASGRLDVMSEMEAQGYFHLFVSAVYFTPLIGACLADVVWGKYRTIVCLSSIYCLGHLALSVDDTRLGLLLGLSLIAIGAGGIKPCVSAHVGDQFGPLNQRLLTHVFSWFYFAINFGALASMLTIPWLLHAYGPAIAFAVPGLLMLVATWVFWSGRYRFIHIPPGGATLFKELGSKAGRKTLAKLVSIYLFIAMFWAMFDQTGSSWVLQAQKMDRWVFGLEWLPSQIQAANPLMIMVLTPLFTYGIYPIIGRRIKLTSINKITTGLFLTAVAFAISAMIQVQLDRGIGVSIVWQIPAYLVLTSAEVMVSITCLELSYRQAPKSMKSLVMALYFLSVSLGNGFTSAVNFFIANVDGSSQLTGSSYFWFFTVIMLLTALMFRLVIRNEEDEFMDDNLNR